MTVLLVCFPASHTWWWGHCRIFYELTTVLLPKKSAQLLEAPEALSHKPLAMKSGLVPLDLSLYCGDKTRARGQVPCPIWKWRNHIRAFGNDCLELDVALGSPIWNLFLDRFSSLTFGDDIIRG